MSYLPFLRPLWRALLAVWNYDADARAEERYLAQAVDIYDLERRMSVRSRAARAAAFAGR
jgi:hypothetical protein